MSLFRLASQELTTKPDWVVTYPPFGLSMGFCLAELFQCKFAYITSLDQPDLPFDIQKNENVLFCADDLYSGGSFFKVLKAIEGKEANLLNPLIVIGNFSGGSTFKGYDVISLMEKEIQLWDQDCPLCAEGSSSLPARKNWLQLFAR